MRHRLTGDSEIAIRQLPMWHSESCETCRKRGFELVEIDGDVRGVYCRAHITAAYLKIHEEAARVLGEAPPDDARRAVVQTEPGRS